MNAALHTACSQSSSIGHAGRRDKGRHLTEEDGTDATDEEECCSRRFQKPAHVVLEADKYGELIKGVANRSNSINPAGTNEANASVANPPAKQQSAKSESGKREQSRLEKACPAIERIYRFIRI